MSSLQKKYQKLVRGLRRDIRIEHYHGDAATIDSCTVYLVKHSLPYNICSCFEASILSAKSTGFISEQNERGAQLINFTQMKITRCQQAYTHHSPGYITRTCPLYLNI
jgi:hypothetical protein